MQATGQVRSFATSTRHQVVILGGGFGGVYTAMRLERLRRAGTPIDVTLVNRENYLVFQPLLAEWRPAWSGSSSRSAPFAGCCR